MIEEVRRKDIIRITLGDISRMEARASAFCCQLRFYDQWKQLY